ncbi:phenylpropionate dioxygenase-like ring-hydroxylating dioxygenase large terminal subunit [Bradyrhizobium sp. USDA 4503]
MTLPSANAIGASQAALKRMADRDTPFVKNAWYLAAYGEEVGRELLARTVLGKKLVFYRTTAGVPVALDDRCAHRSFPLSRSTLDADTIVCGYHGFRYDAEGNWVEVPSQPKCPKGVGIRSYKLVEQGPLIWIWMGEVADANPSLIPDLSWMHSADWEWTKGQMDVKGNYIGLHENLIDLTHLSYLHANSLGSPEYARAPFNVDLSDTTFAVERLVTPVKLPPIWSQSTPLGDTKTGARFARSEFVSPALHLTSARIYDTAHPEHERRYYGLKVAHLITPINNGECRYFAIIGRDFALGNVEVRDFFHNSLYAILNEDRYGLELIEPIVAERDEEFFEVSVASDAAAVAMRRYIKTLALQEQEAGRRPAVAAE